MTFIVIEDTGDLGEALDVIANRIEEATGYHTGPLKDRYCDPRDGDNRAWVVRALIGEEANRLDGLGPDPDMFDHSPEPPPKKPKLRAKRKVRVRGGAARRDVQR